MRQVSKIQNNAARRGRPDDRNWCRMRSRATAQHGGVHLGIPGCRGSRCAQRARCRASFAACQGRAAACQGAHGERDKDRASSLLLRAEVDAELAVTLSKENAQRAEAQAAVERVRQLRQENR